MEVAAAGLLTAVDWTLFLTKASSFFVRHGFVGHADKRGLVAREPQVFVSRSFLDVKEASRR